MTHSLIINGILNLIRWVCKVLKNSICYRLMVKIDNYLSLAARKSIFTNVFTLHNESKIIKNSFIIATLRKFVNKIENAVELITQFISNSRIVEIIKNTIQSVLENPHKFIGTFIIFFTLSNLFYMIILGQADIGDIIARVCLTLAACTLLLVNIDIKKTLAGSRVVSLCKWFLRYED